MNDILNVGLLLANDGFYGRALGFPEAVETEVGDIRQNTSSACEGVDCDIRRVAVAADNGKLMNFIEGAVDDSDDYWVEDMGVLRESKRMEAFNEAGAAIAECAKEEEVSEFANERVWDAEDICEEK